MSLSALQFDDYDLPRFVSRAATFGDERFGYVVTANADHMIRLNDDAGFRGLYSEAEYVLLDSRFLAHFLRLIKGQRLPVCTGSDLTARLFAQAIAIDDRIVLIGGSVEQAQNLAEQYKLRQLAHFNPPMGFIRNPLDVETCLRFIEAQSPFRFCFIGVGSPQQEQLAKLLKDRGIARGLAFCTGASINFLTGLEKRAPDWMQRSGLEWLYRLVQAPRRMAKRYLVRGPRVFGFLLRTRIELRARTGAELVHPLSPTPYTASGSDNV